MVRIRKILYFTLFQYFMKLHLVSDPQAKYSTLQPHGITYMHVRCCETVPESNEDTDFEAGCEANLHSAQAGFLRRTNRFFG